MNVTMLTPVPTGKTEFLWSRNVEVPDEPGCYAISAFDQKVLYVGLATSLRKRMGEHLDDPVKRKGYGGHAPYWFHYLVLPATEITTVERGWLNQSILKDGSFPPLNKVHSPL